MEPTSSITVPSAQAISIAKLQDALAKAQGEFPVIQKDSTVQVKNKEGKFLYSYKYADLTAIISATRPAMVKNGLSFTQDYVKHKDLGNGFITQFRHSSGEILEVGFVPCKIEGQDMKSVAAQYTYGKRISLTAALGISADEDVDAASVEGGLGNQTEKTNIQARPKNHAPQTAAAASARPPDSEPLDEALMAEEAKQHDLMNYLFELVEIRQVPRANMPELIRLVVGRTAKSDQLSVAELQSVISHIKENFQG